MMKKILITIVCLFTSLLALADELQIKDDAPKNYVVKKGDTLWDISAMYLSEPWLWPKLWRMNPEIVNPHLIYPGDELRLVFDADGNPMLVKGKPTLKWSPQIRKTLKEQNPVTYLPFEVVAPYLDYATVMTGEDFDKAPYVLGGDEKYKSNMEGALLYVKGEVATEQHYAIYKKGEQVIDPDSGKPLGYHAILIGTAEGVRKGSLEEKKPSTLYLQSSNQEIRAGAIIVPVNEGQLYPAFYAMQAAEGKEIDARMIRSRNMVREFGKFEVVLLNKGANENIEMGDVYAINRQSPDVIETKDGPIYEEDASSWYRLTRPNDSDRRVEMPKERIGHLMVFKVLDNTSYAIVLSTSKAVHINDSVNAP
ncbi:LysM domain-containing protein [Thalassotalea sp. HSM 43]|uniref:LysM peptidoglycan-binding domain-containing protein n=1 Tax=Thalassotalea sp. HSM 43 TaxID=2552945 RepID=UPI001080F232|nr:LysM domain-containing protein [Thalassotalea sp. HSM 43]QBY04434.1 LysM domain-containing protein [Thalassotalea sp. HSM 43]